MCTVHCCGADIGNSIIAAEAWHKRAARAKWRLVLALALLVLLGHAARAYFSNPRANGGWTLVGWNNLDMHCMDPDYSTFSILRRTTPSMRN